MREMHPLQGLVMWQSLPLGLQLVRVLETRHVTGWFQVDRLGVQTQAGHVASGVVVRFAAHGIAEAGPDYFLVQLFK